ncbi:MAG: DUF5658 family protein [Planctomycetota bacterium]
MAPMFVRPMDRETSRAPASSSRILCFPWLYFGIIVASSLDVWLTGILLSFGAQEVNPLAHAVLQAYGFTGMVIFKYLLTGVVILSCEFVSEHDRRKARMLAVTLVVIHALPLPWSTALLVLAL